MENIYETRNKNKKRKNINKIEEFRNGRKLNEKGRTSKKSSKKENLKRERKIKMSFCKTKLKKWKSLDVKEQEVDNRKH